MNTILSDLQNQLLPWVQFEIVLEINDKKQDCLDSQYNGKVEGRFGADNK